MKHKLQIRNLLLPGSRISIKLHWRRSLVQFILYAALLCFIFSCHQPQKPAKNIEHSFYHWRSVFAPTAFEKNALKNLQVNTLYLKFFDVDWDVNTSQALPVAQVKINDAAFLKTFNTIPVVFITNSCIKNMDSLKCIELAKKLSTLIIAICKNNGLTFQELQIDCDWTALTKEKYFSLLRSLKNDIDNQIKISATIRLYQIKYISKTGVPPVDRGMLMAYNMGNLKDPASVNSILDVKELKKYTGNLQAYPLPLDVALPLFDWKVLFRNNIYAGLIENFPDTFLNNAYVKNSSANSFQFLHDTTLNGYSFFKGDILRKEESNYNEISAAEKIIYQNLSTQNIRLSLFHLDSLILKKYTQDEMQNIFNGLR